jgi:ribA/ribD-fused uncharacterized protein
MEIIDSFTGDNFYLSNFFHARVTYEGLEYPSTEHAYQAAKTLDKHARKAFLHVKAGEAKRMGKCLKIRSDWESVKLGVMKEVVLRKFTTHKDLCAKLLSTGQAKLIEGNDWGDVYWGKVDGKGENHLGLILMEVRSLLSKVAP